MSDTYKTIAESSTGLFKDKGSKFIAYAYPVFTEDEIKQHIDVLKKEHHGARHHCYAYMLGAEKSKFRANDDGEPSNSAGKPILGQLQSNDLTNVLIVVVRYFGGTLLGVGGLINAYRNAAADVIENAQIIEAIVEDRITIEYQYAAMNDVMKIIKDEQLNQVYQDFGLECKIVVTCRASLTEQVSLKLKEIETVKYSIEK